MRTSVLHILRRKVEFIIVFTFLALPFLAIHPGESDASDIFFSQGWQIGKQPTEAEHASPPSDQSHPLKNIAKRRINISTPFQVTSSFLLAPGGQAVHRFSHTTTVAVYQVVPLYQSLQVYRF